MLISGLKGLKGLGQNIITLFCSLLQVFKKVAFVLTEKNCSGLCVFQ